VLLFLAYGALYVFVGVVAGVVVSGALGPYEATTLFNTPASDTAAFGLEREPAEILSRDPLLASLRRLLLLVVSGLLTAAGALVIAIAWFGLREGQPWALIALTLAGLAVIPFWWVALLPYVRAGIPLTPLHVPPFMGIAALVVPAALLGWLGLRTP
jgi:hypothetical protein